MYKSFFKDMPIWQEAMEIAERILRSNSLPLPFILRKG
ncbi:MAG: hypothetical protein DDT22_01317 [candidate division WS2 bacterium]|nr:hypothetical protein [Candidatus Lithacetigena glycinireducens]